MALDAQKKLPATKPNLAVYSSAELLEELGRRGGTLRACADAQLLCIRKADDYRNGFEADGGLDAYFPFGFVSHVQMLHTKVQRLISLARKQGTNFESARDTALDLINYASFLADWLDRKDQGKA